MLADVHGSMYVKVELFEVYQTESSLNLAYTLIVYTPASIKLLELANVNYATVDTGNVIKPVLLPPVTVN